MPVKLNLEVLRESVIDSSLEAIQKEAKAEAQAILLEKVNEYITNIENHPVSEELNAGPEADNTSNTLNGEANLFAFIGFNETDTPIEDLKSLVREYTFLSNGKMKKKESSIVFELNTPSLEDLQTSTKMPFESGLSWLKGIESGISGFGYYLFGIFNNSRSGRGIQSKNKVRKAYYKPVKYFSELRSIFLKGFSGLLSIFRFLSFLLLDLVFKYLFTIT